MVALFEKVVELLVRRALREKVGHRGNSDAFYRSLDPLPIHSLLLERKHVINLLLAPATMLSLPLYPSGTIYKSCLPEVASVRIFFLGGDVGGHSHYWFNEWWKKTHYLSSLLGHHDRHENHPSEKLVRIFNMAIGKELRQYLLTPTSVIHSFNYLIICLLT